MGSGAMQLARGLDSHVVVLHEPAGLEVARCCTAGIRAHARHLPAARAQVCTKRHSIRNRGGVAGAAASWLCAAAKST